MNENLAHILGVELMCAAQGVEFRAPLATSPTLARLVVALREQVVRIEEDRFLADDIAAAAGLVRDGTIARLASLDGAAA